MLSVRVSGPRSNVNEEVPYISQSSRTETSPSDLVSYPGHILEAGQLAGAVEDTDCISAAE